MLRGDSFETLTFDTVATLALHSHSLPENVDIAVF